MQLQTQLTNKRAMKTTIQLSLVSLSPHKLTLLNTECRAPVPQPAVVAEVEYKLTVRSHQAAIRQRPSASPQPDAPEAAQPFPRALLSAPFLRRASPDRSSNFAPTLTTTIKPALGQALRVEA